MPKIPPKPSELREAIATLRRGGVGVLPTDTLYGVVGSVLSYNTVERIYRLRRRNPKKPMIILIGSARDLKKFGVHAAPYIKKLLNKLWPGKISIILPIANRVALRKFQYLHRGMGTLAFRLPASTKMKKGSSREFNLPKFLKLTGPLVAPSANPEGKPPAATIRAAKKYFGGKVDFYVNAGRLNSKPSTLMKVENGKAIILRQGAVEINQ